MLSRTADHLYWMSRYIERAENVARMLNVAWNTSMLQSATRNDVASWTAMLTISGCEPLYAKQVGEVTPNAVMRFMCFDGENPFSIFNCLRGARDNAHAVRNTITSELWETLNSTWIKLRSTNIELMETQRGGFFDWVKFRSHLARGVALGTLLQDEAFWFTQLGAYLERSDNTARLLDVKYHILLPSVEHIGSAGDYYQWSALLRSLSSYEIYRRTFSHQIAPLRVAELLILHRDMPRSLRHCVGHMQDILEKIKNRSAQETLRCCGALHAELQYGRIEDIFQNGLHEFLTRFIEQINRLGDQISTEFLIPLHY